MPKLEGTTAGILPWYTLSCKKAVPRGSNRLAREDQLPVLGKALVGNPEQRQPQPGGHAIAAACLETEPSSGCTSV